MKNAISCPCRNPQPHSAIRGAFKMFRDAAPTDTPITTQQFFYSIASLVAQTAVNALIAAIGFGLVGYFYN